MKLSYSTRGWAQMKWEETVATALEMKFAGIEVYEPQSCPELMGRSGPFH